MALRFPFRLAAAACLGLSTAAGAGNPFKAKTPAPTAAAKADQAMATAIARKLTETPGVRGYQLDIKCKGGEVELTGAVRDAAHREQIINVVSDVDGVTKIDDQMTEKAVAAPVAVQAQALQPAGPPAGLPTPIGGTPLAYGGNKGHGYVGHGHGGPGYGGVGGGPVGPGFDGGMSGGSLPPGAIPGGSLPPGAVPGGAGFGTDPTPIGNGTPGLYDAGPPKMPPYAWPTYAPYPNYSRVGYPTEYPWQAFPFIGPFYPFPKVPLGYRAIKLEWEDGAWYYGRTATKRDWWKIRYW